MEEPLRLPPEKPSEGQPLLLAGGEVDRCTICLRVFGDDLDPDLVSALLGARPTSQCRKGDIHRGKRYDRIEKQGKWLLNFDHVHGVSLDDLINRMLEQVTNDLAVWRELHKRFRVDLFCGLQLELWNRGLVLSPETLRRVAERGLKLGLDIYYIGESEPAEQGVAANRPRD